MTYMMIGDEEEQRVVKTKYPAVVSHFTNKCFKCAINFSLYGINFVLIS